ncbi:ABC transporter permease [Acetobacter cerevisiae]|uniref:ABC transporter permease n=1 Tax=Acetobacter cerevisiae TaxID=178900 RepID=UPI0007860EC8|nr:ABC transporter permease [Acetobacter cerevisiae]
MISEEKQRAEASVWRVGLFEAWQEFQFGMRGPLIPVIFISLTAYLLLVLCQADSLRQLGASDVPRNAPALVYMMTSGDVFFLMFAWAWVFAQPIVRDRRVHLAEITLTTPVSLKAVLLGRFLGATGIALVLGSSQAVGFLLAPVLDIVGLIPTGTMGPPPWGALGWAWLVFTLPSSLGFGAIYLTAGIRTRTIVGPFVAAALIMTIWMIAIVGLKDAGYDRIWTTLLDPSGYAEAESQALEWTPHEKATAFLAVTFPLILNRVVWCILPLGSLAWVMGRVTREKLVTTASGKRRPKSSAEHFSPIETQIFSLPVRPPWLFGLVAEIRWQCQLLLGNKVAVAGFFGLTLIGVAGGISHVMGSADGPLVPHPEVVAPLMMKMMTLMIAFIAAAATGIIMRRDQVPGFDAMLHITPAPYAVRFFGKITAVFFLMTLLALVPAFAGIVITLMGDVYLVDPGFSFLYQIMVSLPALLEMTAAFLIVHLLVRKSGLAYSLAMFLAFVFVLNREVNLVSYPPAKIGIPAAVAYSPLTGWQAWRDYLLLSDLWKLGLVTFTVSTGGLLAYRPAFRRDGAVLAGLWRRLCSPFGIGLACSLAGLLTLAPFLHRLLVTEGQYHSFSSDLLAKAQWERRWVSRIAVFRLSGGAVALKIDTENRTIHGRWQIEDVQTDGKILPLTLPAGLQKLTASLDDRDVPVEIDHDQAGIPTAFCVERACRLILNWTIQTPRWNANGTPPRVVEKKGWLTAADVAPILGVTSDRLVAAPRERLQLGLPLDIPSFPTTAVATSDGIAPVGVWSWSVQLAGVSHSQSGHMIQSPLDFSILLPASEDHDDSRAQTAEVIEADARTVSACLRRRLGLPVNSIGHVVQLPRGFVKPRLSGQTLFLPESPDWDVADRGTGRLLRKVDIAKALSRQIFVSQTDIRQTPGSGWLTEGLSGSLGLLCIGDIDGLAALQTVMERESEGATLALAASVVPVGPASKAQLESWWAEYGPLALLGWAASRTPEDYATLIHVTRETGKVAAGVKAVDPTHAMRLLGMPRASDLHADHSVGQDIEWVWERGQWQPDRKGLQLVKLVKNRSGMIAAGVEPSGSQSFLWVDLGAYERTPADNISFR